MITRGFFAFMENVDPEGNGENQMTYIESVGSFWLDKEIPVWCSPDTRIKIYEPMVMAPISSRTVLAFLSRINSDTEKKHK